MAVKTIAVHLTADTTAYNRGRSKRKRRGPRRRRRSRRLRLIHAISSSQRNSVPSVCRADPASPAPPSDLFSRVCHGDSITRSRDACFSPSRSLPPSSLSFGLRLRRNACARPFIFFSSVALRRSRGRCRRSHDLRYFPPGHFPRARGLFAPSAPEPLSYFPPGNISPTRKTIRMGGRRGGRTMGRAAIGPPEIGGKCSARNNICIRESAFSSLISSRVGRVLSQLTRGASKRLLFLCLSFYMHRRL